MSDMSNADRAERAFRAIQKYKQQDGDVADFAADPTDYMETAISDLVCDLQHLAASYGAAWETIIYRGSNHYHAEVAEEAEEAETLEFRKGDRVRSVASGDMGTVVEVSAYTGVYVEWSGVVDGANAENGEWYDRADIALVEDQDDACKCGHPECGAC